MSTYDSAGSFSKVLFLWCGPLALRGWRRPLHRSDIPTTPDAFRSTPLGDMYADAHADWTEERSLGRRGGPNVAYGPGRAIAGSAFFLGQYLCGLSGFLVTLVRPLLLRELLRAMPPIDGSPPAYSVSLAYGLAVALAVVVWLENYTRGLGLFYAGEVAPLRFTAAALQLIATKLMRLHVAEGRDGLETSLAGNDLLRLEGLLKLLPTAGASLTSLVGGLIALLLTLGPVGLVGLGLMTLVIGLTRHIAQQGKAVQMAMLKAADQRVNVMREIMEGAKVVKMQVWVGSL
jgi:ABC-type multidrug transport system fused ATPase/permease subunit